MPEGESTRAHLLAALGDVEALAVRMSAHRLSSGLAVVRMLLDRRAFLAAELEWADDRARLAEDREADVLTGYRLFVTKALVLTEQLLAAYPDEDPAAPAAAGEALGALVSLRGDVEALPEGPG